MAEEPLDGRTLRKMMDMKKSYRPEIREPNAMILGGTKGLGAAIAEECMKCGWWTVVLGNSVSTDTQWQIDEERRRRMCRVHCNLELTDYVEAVDGAFVDASDAFALPVGGVTSPITHFFWVAGRAGNGEFKLQKSQRLDDLMNVNFCNPVHFAHRVWRHMQSSARRRLYERTPCTFTVVASSSGVQARKNEAVYAATKHAQVGFTRSLALENKNPFCRV